MLVKSNETLGVGESTNTTFGFQLLLFLGKTFYCCSDTLGNGLALTKEQFL